MTASIPVFNHTFKTSAINDYLPKKAVNNLMKYFNTTGICYPEEHYMINMEKRLAEIRELVDQRKYFTINRARQ